MAVDPLVNGIVLALTGMTVPEGDSGRVVSEVARPHLDLARTLADFQQLISQVTGSVASEATGQWSDAYVRAMSSFATSDGADYVQGLKDTAEQLAQDAHEFAYELDYTDRMIIAQAAMFFFEWALTLVLAVFNPIEALVEQAFLRALFRVIFRSTLLRFLASVALFEGLNVGLGAAMDGLVRWSMALGGEHTSQGGMYQRQSIEFGAVQGALSAFVPFLSGPLGSLLAKGLGRNIARDIEMSLDAALRDSGSGGGRVVARGVSGAERRIVSGGEWEGGGGLGLPRDAVGEVGRGGGPLGGGVAGDFGSSVARMARALNVSVVDEGAREAFRGDIGTSFAMMFGRDMGEPDAVVLGRRWADTFAAGFGRKDLGSRLEAVLAGLPRDTKPALRAALSRDVADSVSHDRGSKVAHVLAGMPVNAAHMMVSEGFFNLFTTGHFTAHGASGAAGAFGGLFGHAVTAHATHLGAGLRSKGLAGLFKGLGKGPGTDSGAVNASAGEGGRVLDGSGVPEPFRVPTSGGEQSPRAPFTDTASEQPRGAPAVPPGDTAATVLGDEASAGSDTSSLAG
ncbi:hypothetical protein ABT255_61350, partial [Streptomyces mirabilis]|uniref:WXG100-like domain-containing protein n=1 Tax=Streptomyces mirabilis TaxID=68239 RepID=UPI003350505B